MKRFKATGEVKFLGYKADATISPWELGALSKRKIGIIDVVPAEIIGDFAITKEMLDKGNVRLDFKITHIHSGAIVGYYDLSIARDLCRFLSGGERYVFHCWNDQEEIQKMAEKIRVFGLMTDEHLRSHHLANYI